MRCVTKIIRNDDVSVDTTLEDIKWFSELCDKYGFRVMQCITVIGNTHSIDSKMSNEQIKELGGGNFFENKEVYEYLINRNDIIAVHGLYHTHKPDADEVTLAKDYLGDYGLYAEYFVPPFNEGEYPEKFCGLTVSAKTDRLEDFHTQGIPRTEIAYLHSWRYGKWYKKEDLEQCLQRITIA